MDETTADTIGGNETGRRRVCVVLGMHRSGTSALTRALGLLGGALPLDPLPPSAENEGGFWEPAAIVAHHDRILTSLGLSWDDLQPFPPAWFTSQEASIRARELATLFTQSYGDALLPVLKDPRLCRLLPLWHAVFRLVDVEPLFILALRHPAEVAASLAVRDGMPRPRALLLWLEHVLAAEQASRGFPRVVMDYDRLLADPVARLSDVADALGLDGAALSPDAPGLPDARFRHHCVTDAAPTGLGRWVDILYGRLSSGGTMIDTATERVFDEVRGELDRARDYYSAILDEEAAVVARHIRLMRRCDQASRDIGRLVARFTQARRPETGDP